MVEFFTPWCGHCRQVSVLLNRPLRALPMADGDEQHEVRYAGICGARPHVLQHLRLPYSGQFAPDYAAAATELKKDGIPCAKVPY